MSIVLVGNAPIVDNIGALIDSHDLVVRIGICYLEDDFVKNIGKRADRWAINPCVYLPIFYNPPNRLQKSVDSLLSKIKLIQFLWWENMFVPIINDKKPEDCYINVHFYKKFLKKVKGIPVEAIARKSLDTDILNDISNAQAKTDRPWLVTGMMTIAYYISAFKEQTINIAGFGPRDYCVRRDHKDDTSVEYPPGFGNHDIDMNRRLLNSWIDQGRVHRLEQVDPEPSTNEIEHQKRINS